MYLYFNTTPLLACICIIFVKKKHQFTTYLMCQYIYIYIYVCVSVCARSCVCAHARVCIYIYIFVCVCVCARARVCVRARPRLRWKVLQSAKAVEYATASLQVDKSHQTDVPNATLKCI